MSAAYPKLSLVGARPAKPCCAVHATAKQSESPCLQDLGRCANHPAYEADYCPLCGTATQIGGQA